jgi:predicted esterase
MSHIQKAGSLLVLWTCLSCASALAQSPTELDQTAAAIAALQNSDGGFAAVPGQPSTLGATSSSLRILKYVGGTLPDILKAIEFVSQCVDPDNGGFAPTPGAKPDTLTTCTGIMALHELQLGEGGQNLADRAVRYLMESVDPQNFEQVRLAAAALEAAGRQDAPPAWVAAALQGRNPDGSWGQGPDQPHATGSAAVALLRMGQAVDVPAITKLLRDTQLATGGWGRDGQTTDLAATYRIMRFFWMTRQKPDLPRLDALLARCRQPNGLYSLTPEKPADLSATYMATIILWWSRQLQGLPPRTEIAGFQPLFDGKTLQGWEGDSTLFRAENGVILGNSPGIRHNAFLASQAEFGDFFFKTSFRMRGQADANSGIMFRAQRVPDSTEMIGYQADIGQDFWGCLYDESRRNRVLVRPKTESLQAIHHGDWNEYEIRARGPRIDTAINGVRMIEYRETDPAIPQSGRFGLQIHAGNLLTVEWRDVRIQPLPIPIESDDLSPGFHLRTAQTASGPRKYSLFIPQGYSTSQKWPAILFLHGAGERGEDGVSPAHVGIGPAVLARQAEFPAIVIFPQARETWAAGSIDANSALEILDQLTRSLSIDPDRISLTGISMGGAGTWSIGAATPARFACLAPVCGIARADQMEQLKSIPIWCLTGDADRSQFITSQRMAAKTLRDAGNPVRITEFRGVGHNSWDRSYNNPELLAWMLRQSRKTTP